MTSYCPQCGTPADSGTAYCGSCGTGISAPVLVSYPPSPGWGEPGTPTQQPLEPVQPFDPHPPAAPRGGSPMLIAVGVVLALIVVAVCAVVGYRFLLRPSEPGTVAAPPQSSSGAPSAASSTSSAPSTPSAPPPASPPTQVSYPVVAVAPGGRECGRSGDGPYAAVGTDNESTSCPFALNVQAAYLESGLDGAAGTVVAYSPVTGKTYDLSCSGSQPVLCTGGVAARVVIYGGVLQISG